MPIKTPLFDPPLAPSQSEVIVTAKLKLALNQPERESIRQLSLNYRDALNFASQVAFANHKTSSAKKLHHLTYYDLREKFHLPAQLACQVPREVAAKYEGLWTKAKQNAEHLKMRLTKKRFRGLDRPPHFSSRTYTLTYGRDYSLQTDLRTVRLTATGGRLKCRFAGYTKHLEWLKLGQIGAAKVWYDRSKKNYYLLVSVTLSTPDLQPTDINAVRGIDLNQRNLSTSTTRHGEVTC